MTPVDIAKMTPREKLDLIGELWDSLTDADVALTKAQEAELARRMATFDADTESAIPWVDVKRERVERTR